MKSSNKGFTLVELSIVIVIVGLIIAGVTAGQTLVRQAQLRSILTQADQVRTAVNTFLSQYGGLPGDLNNGFSYWSGCTSTAACNGNGDKKIGTALKAANTSSEGYVAWWELNAAGLFPGTYVTPNTTGQVITGILPPTANPTIPPAKFPSTGMTLGQGSALLTSTTGVTTKNIILFGGVVSSALATSAVLTPAQASSLDTKADDGYALTGSVYGGVTGGSGTALTACASTTSPGAYVVATTTATCTIGFAL